MDLYCVKSDYEPLILPECDSFPELIFRLANKHAAQGKTKYIIDPSVNISFELATYEKDCKNIAKALSRRGFGTDDVLVNLSYDLAHLPTLSMGIWLCNGLLRSSYPEDFIETLKHRVVESKAKFLFCEVSQAKMCLELASAKEIDWKIEVIVNGSHEGCISLEDLYKDDNETVLPKLESDLDRGIIIACTSGTTGPSKGAVHTYRTFLYTLMGFENFGFTEMDYAPNLCISKGTHISGIITPFTFIYQGKTGIFLSNLTKENMFKAIHNFKPAFTWGFPTFLMMLVNDPDAKKYDFSSIELVASGGAPITKVFRETMKKLPNLKDIFVHYGMTEAMLVCTSLNYNHTYCVEEMTLKDVPEISIGKLYPGVALKIIDLDNLEPLGPLQKGEICLKSSYIMSHYYKNKEATEKSYTSDGFFRTGDVGFYDNKNFLFIVDRSKDIFKYFNNHISPTEIETILMTHHAVLEACIIGIEDPEGGGQIPKAFVTLKDPKADLEEIKEFTNSKMPDYKKLRGGLVVLQSMPKGKTGKIERNSLK